jgi:hypothetical protein
MATKKKRSAPKWKPGVKHPVTGKVVGGRAMSKRDQALFKTTGKRRKGVGSAKIAVAYGKKPKAPTKKRKPAKRKTAAKRPVRKTTRKKAPAKRKKAPARAAARTKKGIKVKVPPRAARYVICDGRNVFVASAKTVTSARAKVKALMAKHPKKAFKILDTK